MAERVLPPWPVIKSCKAAGIDCAAVSIFTTQGDNVGDGENLAHIAAKLLVLKGEEGGDSGKGLDKLVRPKSWRHVYNAGQRHGEVY
jgi:hypothetical protein